MAKRKVRNPQYLHEYLGNLTVDELKRLGRHVSGNVPTRKDDIVRLITDELMNPTRLQQVWKQLDSLQQAAVAEVVHHIDNIFDPDAFRAKYGINPNWGTSRSRYGSPTNPSALNLFFYRRVMPTDLQAALKAFVPEPRRAEIKTQPTLPETVPLTGYRAVEEGEVELIDRHTQQMAHNDLLTILRLIEAGKVRITAKTKRPTAATIRAIRHELDGGDYFPPLERDAPRDYWAPTEPGDMRAFAWPMLIQAAKLAELSGSKLQLTNTGKKALSALGHKTLRKIWTSWLKNTLLDEFNRITTIKGQTGRGKRGMTAPSSRRKVIANALAALPVNQWITFDEFSRYMQAGGYTFKVSRDLWDLYIEDSNYGSLGYAGFGDWHIVQARYLLVFLMEYVATLGLIDIAYIPPAHARRDFHDLWGVDDLDCLSDYDGLHYLRLNNLGAWCLDQTGVYEPPQVEIQKRLNVLPNHDIVAIGRLPASDRLQLERFAQQSSDNVWQLDQTKLLLAHEAGLTIAEVQAFLEAKSVNALPQTVTILFQEAAEKAATLIRMEDAYLIEVRDSKLAHLITVDSSLRKHCLLAGDRHIAVAATSFNAFRRALHELGYALPQQV